MGVFGGRPLGVSSSRAMELPAGYAELLAAQAGRDYATVNGDSPQAFRSVAVRSAIDLIASLVSELPGDVFRDSDATRRPLTTPGNLDDPGGDGHGREDWVYQVLVSWLYRANVFGQEVTWDRYGTARQVSLMHPDEVRPQIVEGRPVWYVNGRQFAKPELFYHRRVNPMPGRLLGMSPIEAHAWTVEASLAAQLFGLQFFRDGAHPSGMLVNANPVTDDQAKSAKAKLLDVLRGKREPLVMGMGWDWKQLSITPNESQFLDSQKYTEGQCARMFGPGLAEVLGYESGGSLNYSNVQDRRSDLLTYTLGRWISRIERLLSDLLPAPQVWRFNRDAVLESTTLARYQAHQLAGTWKQINEIREHEDLPPVEWGDVPPAALAAALAAEGDPAGAAQPPDQSPQDQGGGTGGDTAGA